MTVGDLIEVLEDLDEDMEVRVMMQPSWPFEYSIKDARRKSEIAEAESGEESGQDAEDETDVLYLVEGRQVGYGTKAAWR